MNLSPVNPTSPGFVDRFPVKKVALVTTILLLVLGIILIIGGSVGFIPLLPGVISGAILLGVVASVVGFQLVRFSKDKKKEFPEIITGAPEISGMTEIAGVKFNENLMKEANSWCKEELEKRREMVPGDEGYLYNGDCAEDPCLTEDQTVYKICCEEYPEAFRLVCEIGQNKRRAYGVVIGCYPILMQSLIRRGGALLDASNAIRFETEVAASKKCKGEERILYLIHRTAFRESFFYGIVSGMCWLFRSYMTLKTGLTGENRRFDPNAKVDPKDFYTPGTDAYFARQIFNSARKAFLSIFPLELLEKHAIYSERIDFLYEACLAADEGDEFLNIHKDYVYKGREIIPRFCN